MVRLVHIDGGGRIFRNLEITLKQWNRIQRQKEAEAIGLSGQVQEEEKAEKYKKTPGFDCRIRYYRRDNHGWRRTEDRKID